MILKLKVKSKCRIKIQVNVGNNLTEFLQTDD